MTFVHRSTRKRAQPVAKLPLIPASSPVERQRADPRQAVTRRSGRRCRPHSGRPRLTVRNPSSPAGKAGGAGAIGGVADRT